MGALACSFLLAAVASVTPTPASRGDAWELRLRSETRSRSGTTGGRPEAFRLDGELDPSIALRIGVIALSYTPRLTRSLAGAAADPKVLHQAELVAAYRGSGAWSLRGTQRLAYGTIDPSPLAQAGGAFGGNLLLGTPATAALRYVNSDTGVTLDSRPAPGWTLSAVLSWTVNGGLDAAARRTMPILTGPSARALLTWRVTPRDALLTEATVTAASFSNNRDSAVAGVEEIWLWSITRHTALRLGLGSSVIYSRDLRDPSGSVGVLPTGEAEISQQPPALAKDFDLSAAVRATPFLDRIAGVSYERAEARVAAGWSPLKDLRFTAQAAVGLALGGPQEGSSLASGEVGASFVPAPGLSLVGGLRLATQEVPVAFAQWSAFVALSLATSEALPPWRN